MKLGKMLVAVACIATTTVACNRNRQDAILAANEAEKARKGDKEAAIAKLDEAVRLDPDSHAIWYKLATIHEEKEDWPKMAEALQGAITADERNKEDGDWATYHAKRGYALEMQAKKKPGKARDKASAYEEAKAPYQKCIELDENYADCYHQLGNVFLWTDDEQQALDYYTKAIQHDPSQLRYYGLLAELYINLGYMKEAEAVLKEAKTRGTPSDKLMWGIHVLMAQVLQARNDAAGVVTELEAAKAIPTGEGPEGVLILYSLGVAYANLAQPRTQEATDMLKGFVLRVCKGQKAAQYEVECEGARTTLTKKLNATVQ
jgi:tetratricopeptide (TPR) repeat protein